MDKGVAMHHHHPQLEDTASSNRLQGLVSSLAMDSKQTIANKASTVSSTFVFQ